MAVITRLPQGGGSSGDYIFHISTNDRELWGEEVRVTNGNTVDRTVKLSRETGEATIKTNEGGRYRFICGMAVHEHDYSYFGEYDVELVLNTATITIKGEVNLAPPMNDYYEVEAEGYFKPNSVNGFEVRLLDTDKSEDEALIDIKTFADDIDTVAFVVDITQHTNIRVEFSSEDGFITPDSIPYTLERKDQKSDTVEWVEKYARLEVTRQDDVLKQENIVLTWNGGKITYTEKDTDKSEFICKSATEYTATCGDEASGTSKVTSDMLTSSHKAEPIELSTKFPLITPEGGMTGYTTPSGFGEVSGSTEYSGYNAWRAFALFDAGTWSNSTQKSALDWVQFKFDESKCVKEFSIHRQGGVEYDAELVGSTDGVNWSNPPIFTFNASDIEINTTGHFKVTNNTYYKFYRINFKNITNWVTACDIQFWGK